MLFSDVEPTPIKLLSLSPVTPTSSSHVHGQSSEKMNNNLG